VQELRDNPFNQGEIMQCIVTYATGLHSKLSDYEFFLFIHLLYLHQIHVRFNKPSGYQWGTQEFCSGGGGSTNSVDRENGDLGAVAPLVGGSGGSCNLVQEISFHIVKVS
jgi:hypothetical protein